MQARPDFHRPSSFLPWIAILGGLGLLGLLPLSLLQRGDDASTSAGVVAARPQVAYFEFGRNADTLWLTDPARPTQRRQLLTASHAPEYGVVPSLAPDGRRFVYASLPPATLSPSPDTPAELWLADLQGAKPALVASNVDLLVKAVWTPDGTGAVFRRSDDGSHLYYLDLASRQERELVAASDATLFPIAFAPDGSRLYYVRLQPDGSYFASLNLAGGSPQELATLSNGLTRDWALSPDGTRLAFLVMDLGQDYIAAHAAVLDLANGAIAPLGDAAADAFSPVWLPTGELTLGQLKPGQTSAGLVRFDSTGPQTIAGPNRGFDVPLAFSAQAGSFVIRSFNGVSVSAPGNAVLAVLNSDGSRQTIATGEVTFLGWTNP